VNALRHSRARFRGRDNTEIRSRPVDANHRPQLMQRPDGRYEVRCGECERRIDRPLPVGIGVPITNRFEAESILRNHGGRAA